MILDKLQEFIKDFLMGWVMTNLEGIFGDVNNKTGQIAEQIGKSPEQWNNGIFTYIQNISKSVVLPIAGIIIAFVLAQNLYSLMSKRNNMQQVTPNEVNTYIIITAISVLVVTHAFDIVMAIYEIGNYMVSKTGDITGNKQTVDIAKTVQEIFEKNYDSMSAGQLFSLGIETMILSFGMKVMGLIITVILYGRMIYIYVHASAAAIPFATFGSGKLDNIAYNYTQTVCALALQGFLMMLCVGIYCTLVKNLTIANNLSDALWNTMAYTVLLCYSLLKTESWAKGILSAR